MSDYIAELKAVFLNLHNCNAEYVETVPVVKNGKVKRSGVAMLKCSTFAGIRKQERLTVGDTKQLRAAGGVTSRCWNCRQ